MGFTMVEKILDAIVVLKILVIFNFDMTNFYVNLR